MGRPGGWQAKTFSTEGFCPPSVADAASTPTTLDGDQPGRHPGRAESVLRLGRRRRSSRTRRSSSRTADYTRQDRTTFLSPTLPAFVLPADGSLDYVGHYRQTLVNARVDHKLTPTQTLMVRVNVDRFFDTNPNDAVGRHQRAERRAPVLARAR